MSSYLESQSALRRAWADTITSFHKIYFFWAVEVIAAGLGVFIGTIVTPEGVGRVISAIYPVFGGIIGVLAGFSLIIIFNLVLAPYHLLKEAQKRIRQLEIVKEDDKKQAQIRGDIEVLIIEGTDVLNGFKSVSTFDDAWPIEEFKAWRERGSEILDKYKLSTESTLWFRDVYIEVGSTNDLSSFIEACEAGLDRLEDILRSLRS